MTDISLTLSVPPERPVDPALLGALRLIDAGMRALTRSYFVGGAMARDLILWPAHGIRTGRLTRDIDLGVMIEEWDTFEAIKAHFKNSGRCHQDPKVGHRLIFQLPGSASAVPVDLLPFGGIENSDGVIAWPPGSDILMTVAGFGEASQSAVHVQVDTDLIVPTASLPAQAVLKLIAWMDRGQRTDKDATDFLLLISNYHSACNEDRLYEEEVELLAESGYDLETAGAMLLGKDATQLCSAPTAARLTVLFSSERYQQRLLDLMIRQALLGEEGIDATRVAGYLHYFHLGFDQALKGGASD
jgi:predicted nucleotidyltransferase